MRPFLRRLLRPRVLVPVVLLVLVGAGALWWLFAPKPTTTLSEAAPQGQTLLSGAFRDGAPLHHASGQASLVRLADGSHALWLQDYDATSGPDVWFYLTPSNDPMTAGDVEGQGARLRTPHGFMGQATARGDFLVPLPADLDPTRYGALVAWCETYNVVFGFAPLR